jgi:hypothetical protein
MLKRDHELLSGRLGFKKTNKSKIATLCIAIFLIFAIATNIISDKASAEDKISFYSTNKFDIPVSNGTIRFAYNGTYASANLENGTWIFKDIILNNLTLSELRVSVQNSNIKIISFFAYTATSYTDKSIQYYAEGKGSQTVNLGFNAPTDSSSWSVINEAFLAEGNDWQLLSDGTVVVNGQEGTVNITHFDANNSNSNSSFGEQHSLIITIIVLVSVTFAIGLIVSIKERKRNGN